MKNRKEIELFQQTLLSVPIIKKCELKKSLEKENIFEIKTEEGICFEIKVTIMQNAYPKQVSELFTMENRKEYHVIMAPYISEATEKIFRENGAGYIDIAGNCMITYHSIYIHVTGKKNEAASKRYLKSIFERSSIVSSRVLRVMLNETNKTWKLKELSEVASCSIGQIAKVKDFLIKNNWVEKTTLGIKLVDINALLAAWSIVYGNKENEIYECYSLDDIADIEIKLENMKKECGIEYYLTGFSGGVRYEPVVRYKKVHCYIGSEYIQEAMHYLECKQVDSGANISLIVPYDECVLLDNRYIRNNQVVSPVQVYLDCMNMKGRGEELAQAVLSKEIL